MTASPRDVLTPVESVRRVRAEVHEGAIGEFDVAAGRDNHVGWRHDEGIMLAALFLLFIADGTARY